MRGAGGGWVEPAGEKGYVHMTTAPTSMCCCWRLAALGRCRGRGACAGDAGTTVNLSPSTLARDDWWWAEVDRREVEPRG